MIASFYIEVWKKDVLGSQKVLKSFLTRHSQPREWTDTTGIMCQVNLHQEESVTNRATLSSCAPFVSLFFFFLPFCAILYSFFCSFTDLLPFPYTAKNPHNLNGAQATAFVVGQEVRIDGTINNSNTGPGYTLLESVKGSEKKEPMILGYYQVK